MQRFDCSLSVFLDLKILEINDQDMFYIFKVFFLMNKCQKKEASLDQ